MSRILMTLTSFPQKLRASHDSVIVFRNFRISSMPSRCVLEYPTRIDTSVISQLRNLLFILIYANFMRRRYIQRKIQVVDVATDGRIVLPRGRAIQCSERTFAPGISRLRLFDLVDATLRGGKTRISVKIYQTPTYKLRLYSSHSGVQSNIVTLLVSRYTDEMYATP